jgi:metallo-beta-lactamase family protein
MKIKFLGAVGSVTGSCTLLESADGLTQLLVDCGMTQGESDSLILNTAEWPFVVSNLSFVLLTHAHLDHCGLLCRLVRDGFSGPVYCTRFTAELAKINLRDAARLSSALSSEIDVGKIRFTAVDEQSRFEFGQPFELTNDLQAAFHPSAHIGGACSIGIRWKDNDTNWREIVFSGDLGPNVTGHAPQPLLAPRQLLPTNPEYMVVESTYGSRIREEGQRSASVRLDDLERVIATAMDFSPDEQTKSPPCVIAPCFSIHRTQELLVDLHALFEVRMKDRILSYRPAFTEPEHIEKALEKGIRPSRVNSAQSILALLTTAEREHFHELFQLTELFNDDGTKKDMYVLMNGSDARKAEARTLLTRTVRPNVNIKIRVLVDSPMSRRATTIYRQQINKKAPHDPRVRIYRNPALVKHLGAQSEGEVDEILDTLFAGESPGDKDAMEHSFLTYSLTFCHPSNSEQVLKPDSTSTLDIVLSGSGMADVGPITSHLSRELPKSSAIVLLTGYAPPSSVAGRLRAFSKTGTTGPEGVLRLPAGEIADSKIRARVIDIGAYYSGHADQVGLLDFVFATAAESTPQSTSTTVFLNHGSDDVRDKLRAAIMERSTTPHPRDRQIEAVEIPGRDPRWFDLDEGEWLQLDTTSRKDTHEQLLLRLYLEQRRTNDLLDELIRLTKKRSNH